MNKDELKNKVLKERFIFVDKTGEPHMAIKADIFTQLIDQLDEPKPQLSGKYELKEFLDRVLDERHFDSFNEVYDDIISFIDDQLDEPEKVVVPDFVGEFIEECKESRYKTLFYVFAKVENRDFDLVPYEIYEWIIDNSNDEVFARAWLDGWTVEEKKYVIKDVSGEVMLYKKDNEIKRTAYTFNLHEDSFRLTEQEIKDYDERYWPFADEVTNG